jgi:CheY-like chemotaxis protein
VLLVEDNPTNAIPAFDYLAAKGYRVIHARDGYEALAEATALRPRIILMDIMMPRMDGLEAIRRLRAIPDTQIASTPIIVVTARAMQGDREACLEAGADEYMAKPISLKTLLGNIEALLGGRRT